MPEAHQDPVDIFVLGGGINGCGIARDAAGRGMSVSLAEMNDLGSGASSASGKLLHSGLRRLEDFKLRPVREALRERDILLRTMPHIAWPMRFVLPLDTDKRFAQDALVDRLRRWGGARMRGHSPAWLVRLGLRLYGRLGERQILPGTAPLDLQSDPVGAPLQDRYLSAFEYSGCGIDDARLVVLNARDAQARGAEIMTRTQVVHAEVRYGLWHVSLSNGEVRIARTLVNAGGPWVMDVIRNTLRMRQSAPLPLERSSQIVLPKLYAHDKCYVLQADDGRIIYTLPFEGDFTLVGSTAVAHSDAGDAPECSAAEQAYLCALASEYFAQPVRVSDIVWRFSGLHLHPDALDHPAADAAAPRAHLLKMDSSAEAPLLHVMGGPITTYRLLAEQAMEMLQIHLTGFGPWTADAALPGGGFAEDAFDALIDALMQAYPFLSAPWARRLARAYGSDAPAVLGDATTAASLGRDFGATLTAREVAWLMSEEFAQTAEDVLWRRSKLGLKLSPEQVLALETHMRSR